MLNYSFVRSEGLGVDLLTPVIEGKNICEEFIFVGFVPKMGEISQQASYFRITTVFRKIHSYHFWINFSC